MTNRLPELQNMLRATGNALRARATQTGSPESVDRILEAAANVGAPGATPRRLPVCDWYDRVISDPPTDPDLAQLFESLRALSAYMVWRTREADQTASEGFATRHANAMLLGPGGIEQRNNVWIGLSLMSPDTRYPDHRHKPEETYLALSPGQFRQGDGDWFEPGVGGSFYNPPNILHGMRSGDAPLLALWALWVPQGTEN